MSDLPQVVDDHIKAVEGGFQADPRDPGNWTGGEVGSGQLIGTKYGISAAANPDVDIRNLTWPQAEALYVERYWRPAGCEAAWDAGDRALAVMTMDAAIHSGVDRARAWIEAAGGNYMVAVATRLLYLASLAELWPTYGRGWTKRIARLLSAASGLEEQRGTSDSVVVSSIDASHLPWPPRIGLLFGRASGPFEVAVASPKGAAPSELVVRPPRID